jgi:hypothetical protein
MGNAQLTQLSKALASGADKGIFVLPKGMLISRRSVGTDLTPFRSLWPRQVAAQEFTPEGCV